MWETLWKLMDGHNGVFTIGLVVGFVSGTLWTVFAARPRFCARCGQYNQWINAEKVRLKLLKQKHNRRKGDKDKEGAVENGEQT
jgi:hypothetical protein